MPSKITDLPEHSPLTPQTFDILPKLHLLLSRLLPQPADPISTSTATPTYQKLDALSLKDLETEAASIKVQIQKAKAAVEGLPDIDRSLEEQGNETSELEGRIDALKDILRGTGKRVVRGEEEDSS